LTRYQIFLTVQLMSRGAALETSDHGGFADLGEIAAHRAAGFRREL